MDLVRTLVSKQKRRWEDDGFNLDLTYITDQIIAMGFPSESTEGWFRNPLSEVQRFLKERHDGHYHVFNLCIERSYKAEKFGGHVSCYPFADHNAPSLQMIRDFCLELHTWLNSDPRNVAAIHCKAGKGRTGTMICCYLLYCGAIKSSDDVLEFYGVRRTYNGHGVTIPSQRRYVHYYWLTLQPSWDPNRERIFWNLRRITLSHKPKGKNGQPLNIWKPLFGVTRRDKTLLYVAEDVESDSLTPTFQCDGLPIQGDIKFELFNVKCTKKLFWFWINTSFIQPSQYTITLSKPQIDGAAKDKENQIFPADFTVTLHFERMPSRMRNKGSKAPQMTAETIQSIRSISPGPIHQKNTIPQSNSQATSSTTQSDTNVDTGFRTNQSNNFSAAIVSSPPRRASNLDTLPAMPPRVSLIPNNINSNSSSPIPDSFLHSELNEPFCEKCSLTVSPFDQIVQSEGKIFHWACVLCSICGDSFSERKSGVVSLTSRSSGLICANCESGFWVRCSMCSQALVGDRFSQTLPNIGKLCQSCFSCSICRTPFNRADDDDYDEIEDAFDVVDGRLVCISHSQSSRKIFFAKTPPSRSRSLRIGQRPSQGANTLSHPNTSSINQTTSPEILSTSPTSLSQLHLSEINLTTIDQSSSIPASGVQSSQAQNISGWIPKNPTKNELEGSITYVQSSAAANGIVIGSMGSEPSHILRKQKDITGNTMALCTSCNTAISVTDQSIYVPNLHKSYHADHFKCSICNFLILSADLYHVVGDSILCNDCNSASATCFKCNKPILGNAKQVGPELYVHSECFSCYVCKKLILGSFLENDGQYICWPCNHNINLDVVRISS